MSLRWRIALAMAAIAAVATIAIGTASYRESRDRLFAEVDRSLVELERFVTERRIGQDALPERGPLFGFDAQVLNRNGEVVQSTFPVPLDVGDEALTVVGQPRASVFSTVAGDGADYRVRTVGVQRGAVQIGRSLEETERVLQSLRARVLVWVLIVAGVAVAAGLWIASRVTSSLRRLTVAAEHVEATGRLDISIDESGTDEVGRLGVAFDRMLSALARSQDEQHRLVQDAGHELRTPLTSLRTNLDTLLRYPDLSASERHAVIGDLHAETEELTDLVNEIIAVATGSSSGERVTDFDLTDLVSDVAARYARRSERTIDVEGASVPVSGQYGAIHRAVSCLVENACKFDDSGGPIDVDVRQVDGVAEIVVSDRGPGIAESESALVFERFHRADDARTLPGSGLGLSIVRDVARRHGGDAVARRRDGGGASVSMRIARAPLPPPGG